jgi:hypothetical protein
MFLHNVLTPPRGKSTVAGVITFAQSVAGGFRVAGRRFFQLSGGTLPAAAKSTNFAASAGSVRVFYGTGRLPTIDYPGAKGRSAFPIQRFLSLYDGFSCDFAHCEVETHSSRRFRNFSGLQVSDRGILEEVSHQEEAR